MRRFATLFLLLTLAVIGAFYWAGRGAKEGEVRKPEGGAPGQQEHSDALPDGAQLPSSEIAATREEAASSRLGLTGRVIDGQGHPVEGATVQWVAYRLEDQEPTVADSSGAWGVLGRVSVGTLTEVRGGFVIEAAPEEALPHGSVVVASKPGFGTQAQELPSGQVDGHVELVLEEVPVVLVRVRDAAGAPVGGATVRMAGGAGPRAAPTRHEQFVQPSVLTDASGEARLCRLKGKQAIWAEKGELVSDPWQGLAPTTVELTLGESFTVGGTLATERHDWFGYVGERRIVVARREGNLWRTVASLRGVLDGPFGPLRVPRVADGAYQLRLEGLPIAPQAIDFEAPPAGAHRSFDFLGRKDACEVWFEIEDLDGNRIPGASVTAWWDQPAAGEGPRTVHGSPRHDGQSYTGTFPPGLIQYEARAPGFGAATGDVQVPVDFAVIVTLEPGGRVAGRVERSGVPVRDFQLIYWKDGNVRVNRSVHCFDRANGEFVVEDLAVGDWRFQAATPEFPPGRPVSVSVQPGATAEVVVALESALPGAGRVVDRITSEPVPEAEVTVLGPDGFGLPWLWFECTADGTFEAEAFHPGTNHLLVRAPGYAETRANAGLTGDFLDWGELRLARPQALEVQLLGLEEWKGDRSQLSAASVNGPEVPYTPFDRDGRARIAAVPPGELQLVLNEGPSAWTRLQLLLEVGKEWTFEHRLAGARRLEVRLLDAEGEVEQKPYGILVSTVEPSGISTLRARGEPRDGLYTFEGIESDSVQVWVTDNGAMLTSASLQFGAESTLRADLELGGERLRVQVLDPAEVPLVGAWVTIRSADGERILGADDTDPQGWAELSGVPAQRLLTDVHHPTAGWRFGVPIDAAVREQEFVLAAAGSIELAVSDGVEPLAGVTTRLETPAGLALTRPRETGADGRVRYAPLGEGRYRLVCRRNDCWTVVADVELAADAHVTPSVTLPRLAEVELLVRSAEGTPLAGAEVELVHQALAGSARAWLEASLVQGTLRTAQDGHLTLRGLPSGAYTWRVEAPVRAEGSLVVAPGPNELELRPLP